MRAVIKAGQFFMNGLPFQEQAAHWPILVRWSQLTVQKRQQPVNRGKGACRNQIDILTIKGFDTLRQHGGLQAHSRMTVCRKIDFF